MKMARRLYGSEVCLGCPIADSGGVAPGDKIWFNATADDSLSKNRHRCYTVWICNGEHC